MEYLIIVILFSDPKQLTYLDSINEYRNQLFISSNLYFIRLVKLLYGILI